MELTELVRLYVEDRKSIMTIARLYEKDYGYVRRRLLKAGVKLRRPGETTRTRVVPGREASGYKLDELGYVRLYRPDHPAAQQGGYVFEHRFVMEQVLGRALLSGESVHHINGVRHDNRAENLRLFESNAAHVRVEHGRPVCSVSGCTREHRYGGLCNEHAAWKRRNGGQEPTYLIGQGNSIAAFKRWEKRRARSPNP